MIEAAATSGRSRGPDRREVHRIAIALARSQPAMGAFLEWASELEALGRSTPPRRTNIAIARWARQRRRELEVEFESTVRWAIRRVPRRARVVTLSRSSLVGAVLTGLSADRQPALVEVLRSRPGGEGAAQVRDLRKGGIRARIVDDALGPAVVRRADLVLVGADAVLGDGALIHKVGTRPLARAAHRAGVPFVSVAGRSKFTRRIRPVGQRWPALFDRTPASWVTEYWTDAGPVHPRAVRRRPLGRRPKRA